MKLQTKLTVFSAISKLLIVVLFVLILPSLVQRIAFVNTNKALVEQKAKVLKEVRNNGIDYYLQGEPDYGSYSMLKDEYISLEPMDSIYTKDTVETADRMIEGDTITYRILTHTFPVNNQTYLLEIGKRISVIKDEARALQKMALYVLTGLILLTLLTNYIYTRHLLLPLNAIIKSKLKNRKFPFKDQPNTIHTSTYDFKYLDNSINELMQQINHAFEKEREFTSNASHELMTPISIMQSKIENMMMDPAIDNAYYHKLEQLMVTLKRLKKIVHSLLLISRIENEQYVRNDDVEPKLLIQEITEELSHRLYENNLQLIIDLRSNIILHKLNKDLLFQLFYNLIHNAIRYNTPNGKIIINDDYIPNKNYTISITDTGKGISENHIDSIFDRFKKANQSSHENFGLGLSIVKSIVQYQGLNIKVSSAENNGSTFYVIFTTEHL